MRNTRARLSGAELLDAETMRRELDPAEQWLWGQPDTMAAIVAALEHEYGTVGDDATLIGRKHAHVSNVLEAWRAAGSPAQ